MSFESEYLGLLIKQYWEQTNAPAEINLKSRTWREIFDWLNSFHDEFDIDLATGDRLDKIGKIVGLSRNVTFLLNKIAFGFDENTNARSFDDRFTALVNRAPFADKTERAYTNLQLDDNDYRLFLKAKIAKNSGSAFMVSDVRTTIQDVINTAFEGNAYVLDNQNMSLTLYVSPLFDFERLKAIRELDLLPKPQGVRYDIIILAAPGETFGFADNPHAQPFANKFDPANEPGGRFATKVLN